jgi:hypothetical protein
VDDKDLANDGTDAGEIPAVLKFPGKHEIRDSDGDLSARSQPESDDLRRGICGKEHG